MVALSRRLAHGRQPVRRGYPGLNKVLVGHLNHFAVSGNDPSLWWFFNQNHAQASA